jgi:hypothetical protein
LSYSRWSNSRWYTFWCVQPRDQKETRASALFEVCGIHQFNAAELRKNLDMCAELAASKEKGDPVTKEELEELKGYMRDFLADVDEKYPKAA